MEVMVIGRVASIAAQVVSTMVLARIVSVEAFGVMVVSTTIVALAQVLSTLGLGPALVQRPEVEQRHIDTAMVGTSILAGAIWVIAISTSGLVVSFFGIADHLALYLFVITAIPLGALTSVAASLLQRHLEFRRTAGIELASYVFGYGMPGIILALAGLQEWALAAGLVGQALYRFLAYQARARRLCGLHLFGVSMDRQSLQELSGFSAGYSVGALASFVSLQGDNLVLGKQASSATLAYYSRAYQLVALPANLAGYALDAVLFPVLAQIQDRKHRMSEVYMVGLTLMSVIFLPMSVLICMTADPLVRVILGDDWLPVGPVLTVLGAFTFFRMAYKLPDSVTRAIGIVNQRAMLKIVYGMLVVVAAIVGSTMSVLMVALLVGVAVVVNYALMSVLTFRHIPFSPKGFTRAHVRGLALSGLSFATLECLDWLDVGWGSPLLDLLVSWSVVGIISLSFVVAFPITSLGRPTAEFIFAALPRPVTESRLGRVARKRAGLTG